VSFYAHMTTQQQTISKCQYKGERKKEKERHRGKIIKIARETHTAYVMIKMTTEIKCKSEEKKTAEAEIEKKGNRK
jgi:hypothetical protein